MRFILNFFIFGFIFYLIYIFFPEAFNTLVSWANSVYDFLSNLIRMAIDKMSPNRPPSESSQQAMVHWFFG